jgi:predicted phage terminase large subunit-like protein
MFSQEYEAEFISAGAGMFKQAWFRYWHWPSDDNHEAYVLGDRAVAVGDCKRFTTVDLAWTVGERADYTVICTWAVTPNKELILIDAIRAKLEGPDIIPHLKAVFGTYEPGYIAVEKATKTTSILQEAVREGLPVKEIRAEKKKEMRAMLATARMERGLVWFPMKSRNDWVDELETELLVFPNGAHDDFVDNVSYACLEIARPGSKLVSF